MKTTNLNFDFFYYHIIFLYRYSRDYYINDSKFASGGKNRLTSNMSSPTKESSTSGHSTPVEVNRNGNEYKLKSTFQQSWNLSNPVRRTNSLNTVTLRSSPLHDATSQFKKKSVNSVLYKSSGTRPMSMSQSSSPNHRILTQFEKQLLHKDLKRNSFRAISSTTKDFVLNPLFDSELFYVEQNGKALDKFILKNDTDDSGVDSCLNGYTGSESHNLSNEASC